MNDDLFSITGGDLMTLVNEQIRLEKTELFRDYLASNKYKKVLPDRYKKGMNEDIELYKEADDLRYKNHLMASDQGSLTQFIMNRLDRDKGIIPQNELSVYVAAVQIALDFEKSVSLKLNTTKTPRYIKNETSHSKKNKL